MDFPALPYFPITIDTEFSHLRYAVCQCLQSHDAKRRKMLQHELQKLWISESNPNYVMALLSVRTGFDLFLTVKNFPPGSEVIMSAINIPDMIPLDISIDTLEPKIDLLPKLISAKTVAIVVAHLYGRIINMQPVIDAAAEFNLAVIEDCAESFCGFSHIGHPDSDLALFSFGVMKFYTSFGGCIAKVKDQEILQKMQTFYETYPVQTSGMYLKKVLKYSILYSWLQVGFLPKFGQEVLSRLGVDYKSLFVGLMRGFPDKMLEMIRWQPSTALLATMLYRQKAFKPSEFDLQKIKGQYFLQNLPEGFEAVGEHAYINNFWLFPVLVEEVDTVVNTLNLLGVEAYRGATQLSIVEPSGGEERSSILDPLSPKDKATLNAHYPHEAKFLIDHVIYLPVHKLVPIYILDQMLKICSLAMKSSKQPDTRFLPTRNKLFKSKL
ncbi:unnamed protein product [Candidula unifasciata]|uniref:DegT/DnrJ/EryC1/StrS aminotransferase family protein n=1 Tax=Candidula unifasciata TaxID=100452 RepID=A0A8S4A2D4_9EUPU|nr:unnamed protein product [Candidula unifasciata]